VTTQYRNNPDQETLGEIENTLNFIRQHSNELIEIEGDSKWTAGNVLFRDKDEAVGMYTYMVGALSNGKVTLHIMPLYAVDELNSKYSSDFKPFSSGKSCIKFSKFSDLPIDALRDVIQTGAPLFRDVMKAFNAKRKKENVNNVV
jgi:hypothetical protein